MTRAHVLAGIPAEETILLTKAAPGALKRLETVIVDGQNVLDLDLRTKPTEK